MPLSFSKLLLVVLASTSIVSAEKKLETLDLEGKTMNGILMSFMMYILE